MQRCWRGYNKWLLIQINPGSAIQVPNYCVSISVRRFREPGLHSDNLFTPKTVFRFLNPWETSKPQGVCIPSYCVDAVEFLFYFREKMQQLYAEPLFGWIIIIVWLWRRKPSRCVFWWREQLSWKVYITLVKTDCNLACIVGENMPKSVFPLWSHFSSFTNHTECKKHTYKSPGLLKFDWMQDRCRWVSLSCWEVNFYTKIS